MNIYQMIIYILLVIMAVCDHRKMEIPVILIFAGITVSVTGVISDLVTNRFELISITYALVPGIILLIIHVISPQKIGIADGITMIIALLGLSVWRVYLSLLCIALISFLVALVLAIKWKGLARVIPFVPIITVGHILAGVIDLYWRSGNV